MDEPARAGRRRGRVGRLPRTARLVAVLLPAALLGCALPQVQVPQPVPRSDLAELQDAVAARFRADGSARLHSTVRISGTAPVPSVTTSDGAVRLTPDGVAATTTSTTAGTPPATARFTILPDAAYVAPVPGTTPPATAQRPWIRLDPGLGDPLSRSLAGAIALQQQAGRRLYCFTELGAARIVDHSEETIVGIPTVRYRLTVDLRSGAADEASAAVYRGLGLTTLEVSLWVAADDRVPRCEVAQALPGGRGRVVADQVFYDFGVPAAIDAPPPGQVVTLPVAGS